MVTNCCFIYSGEMTERPTLSWVDIDDVIKIAKHRFEKAIKSVQDEGAGLPAEQRHRQNRL
jgi:hypothetical protein